MIQIPHLVSVYIHKNFGVFIFLLNTFCDFEYTFAYFMYMSMMCTYEWFKRNNNEIKKVYRITCFFSGVNQSRILKKTWDGQKHHNYIRQRENEKNHYT